MNIHPVVTLNADLPPTPFQWAGRANRIPTDAIQEKVLAHVSGYLMDQRVAMIPIAQLADAIAVIPGSPNAMPARRGKVARALHRLSLQDLLCWAMVGDNGGQLILVARRDDIELLEQAVDDACRELTRHKPAPFNFQVERIPA